jgi:hypothetical protein
VPQRDAINELPAVRTQGSCKLNNEQDACESFSLILVFTKHSFVVLEKRLNGNTLLLNVGKFALDVHGTHDSRGEYDSDVERSHLASY